MPCISLPINRVVDWSSRYYEVIVSFRQWERFKFAIRFVSG